MSNIVDSTEVASIPIVHEILSEEKLSVAEFNQRHWLGESRLWLEHVDSTLLVLAIGKPELQKSKSTSVRGACVEC